MKWALQWVFVSKGVLGNSIVYSRHTIMLTTMYTRYTYLHLLTRYFIYDSTHLNCKKWRNLIACGFDSTTIFNSEKSNFKQPLLQLGDTLRILCTLLLFDQIHFPKSEPCRAITYIQCTSHALIASAWELLVTVFKNKKLQGHRHPCLISTWRKCWPVPSDFTYLNWNWKVTNDSTADEGCWKQQAVKHYWSVPLIFWLTLTLGMVLAI